MKEGGEVMKILKEMKRQDEGERRGENGDRGI